MTITALLSIHDVMPDTIERVKKIVDMLGHIPPAAISLLVVPGLPWSEKQLETLRSWSNRGLTVCGHGRIHRCGEIKTLYHRLHRRFVSRDVAEHLSLDEDAIADLISDCHQWLHERGLGNREIYVPPAWAMGQISRRRLSKLPFRFYETQTGIFDSRVNRFRKLPLCGYEADTLFRAVFLRGFNWANRSAARILSRPLRISVHPFDLDYRLGEPLKNFLRSLGQENSKFAAVDPVSFLAQ